MRQIRHRPFKSLSRKFALAMSLGFSFGIPLQCAAVEELSATSIVKKLQDSSDGHSFLQSLIERVKSLNDYWYESTLTTYTQKGKTVVESGRFYFKAPRMVRFEALKAGKRSGSIVVCQPDGKIKAKAGGMMRGITVTLSPNSKMLMTSNGYNIVESDLSSLLQSLRSSMKSGLKCVASNSPCPYPGLAKAYVLELIGADDLVTQRVAIDTERKLPAEWAIFNNGKAISMACMKNITVNANIANDMFFINRHADDEKALGSAYNEVLDKLKKKLSMAGTLNLEFVRDTKQASNELKHTSELLRHDKLTERTADKPEAVSWLNFGRSILLTRTASMELIAESLKELQPLIQNFENKHGACAGTTEQWMNSLKSIDRSISNLYGVLESDVPNSETIVREAENIKAQANALDAASAQISENLD